MWRKNRKQMERQGTGLRRILKTPSPRRDEPIPTSTSASDATAWPPIVVARDDMPGAYAPSSHETETAFEIFPKWPSPRQSNGEKNTKKEKLKPLGGSRSTPRERASNHSSTFDATSPAVRLSETMPDVQMDPSMESIIARRIKALRLAELYLQGPPRSRESFLSQCDKQDIVDAISLLEEMSKSKKSLDEGSRLEIEVKPLNKDDVSTEETVQSTRSANSLSSSSLTSNSGSYSKPSQNAVFPLPFSCGGSIPEDEVEEIHPMLQTSRTCCSALGAFDGQHTSLNKLSRKMKLREHLNRTASVRRENSFLDTDTLNNPRRSWSLGDGDITWDSDTLSLYEF